MRRLQLIRFTLLVGIAAIAVTSLTYLSTESKGGIQVGYALRGANNTFVFQASLSYRYTELFDLSPYQYDNYSKSTVDVTSIGLAGASKGMVVRTQFLANMCLTNAPFFSVEETPNYRKLTYGKVYPLSDIVVPPRRSFSRNPPTTTTCHLHIFTPLPQFLNYMVVQLPRPGNYVIRGINVFYTSMGVKYREDLPGTFRIDAVK
jgi:hypothetical protein